MARCCLSFEGPPSVDREDEKGVRQEGVAAKVHGRDPTRPIFHEVGKHQVRYAEAQAVNVLAKFNAPLPPCVA
jgi:hypothetical protein